MIRYFSKKQIRLDKTVMVCHKLSMKTFLCAVVGSWMLVGFLFAESQGEVPANPEVGSVENADWIKAHMDQEVTITGVPNAKSATSVAGHCFYNFDHSEMILFCFKAVAETLPADKKPAALMGKTIRVKGKLTLYKGKPQMVIRNAEQIEILPSSATGNPAPAVQKKEVE
jgi:DNA/RNA endonuclease YhcR with UshA esterase domain